MDLKDRSILITGAAVRVGAAMARAVAAAGGRVLLHYGSSKQEARQLKAELAAAGGQAELLQGDLADLNGVADLIERAQEFGPLYGLVNSAAIFENLTLENTTLAGWQRHLGINLTAPFLLSQAFWKSLPDGETPARIVNILDWRALRPGADHLPYTVSKAALAALTQSLAVAMAPRVCVNGIAFGAILPPSDKGEPSPARMAEIIKDVPAGRWAELDEVGETLLFLLSGPAYINGEIIYLDGGRHLV